MAGITGASVQYVGTAAAPIALGATGGASDVWTWTHNRGKKAAMLQPLVAASGALHTPASIVATQPDANTIVLTNSTAGALDVVLRVTWEDGSVSLMAPLAASVGTLA